MRALAICLLLFQTLLASLPGGFAVRQSARLSEQYAQLRHLPGVRTLDGFELLAIGGLLRVHRPRHVLPTSGPSQSVALSSASAAGTASNVSVTQGSGSGLQTTYYGANLPFTSEGQIYSDPSTE